MSTGPWSLVDISNAAFRSTAQADKVNQDFLSHLGLQERYGPARLAIARSLAEPSRPADTSEESSGKVIPGNLLFGSDLAVWVALLTEHYGSPITSSKELQVLVRNHWHRGMQSLEADWKGCGENYDEFILRLASRAGLQQGSGSLAGESLTGPQPIGPTLHAMPVFLRIGDPGTDLVTKQPVNWVSNAAGYAPHVAVMGGTNSGKTHSTLKLLRQLEKQAKCPILFFDIAG